ncbi:MAG: hypothetical protein K2M12_07350, partial [Muribaculaceae bacterium]|nr:hypothetical protein [Muribaculaceae bacterium]
HRTPAGQPRLYVGKERMAETDEYDYGARRHHAAGLLWSVPDALASTTPGISPYVFCNANPIANVDNDGNLSIFINGWHYGDGGTPAYWDGADRVVMNATHDYKAMYIDGSMGGAAQNIISYMSIFLPYLRSLVPESNLNPAARQRAGYEAGKQFAAAIAGSLDLGERIRIITHSMGAAFCKGFLQALAESIEGITDRIDLELDVAPYQPEAQEAVENVTTILMQHTDDWPAGSGEMEGAERLPPKKATDMGKSIKAHKIESFKDELLNFFKDNKEGTYQIKAIICAGDGKYQIIK